MLGTSDKYLERFRDALDRTGNLHTIDDILEALDKGDMQSFARGNTWIITTINVYPRRVVLDIAYLVGDLEDAEILHDDILKFAKKAGCTMVRTYGRLGWKQMAEKHGWRFSDAIYVKDIEA